MLKEIIKEYRQMHSVKILKHKIADLSKKLKAKGELKNTINPTDVSDEMAHEFDDIVWNDPDDLPDEEHVNAEMDAAKRVIKKFRK